MNEIKAVVFDLYGTLFDVHSVAECCERFYPQRGREISLLWRQKQLEYTWLRSLMKAYCNFEHATEDALVYTCGHLGLALAPDRQRVLCDAYLRLQPFPEVPAALARLNALGLPLAILSNGSVHSIDTVVRSAGLLAEFAQLISVEAVQVFKPHPSVYALAEQRLGIARREILFVSSNAWDASGARQFGHPVCWVNRAGNCFDELGHRPDHTVSGIDALVGLLEGAALTTRSRPADLAR